MDICGYTGRIVSVDLSSGKITKEELDMELAKAFIGGFGLSNRIAFDLMKPGIDSLSPENPMIISAGPFVGTPITGASKVSGTTKLPQAGTIGTGIGSMRFGSMLKWAGWDVLVITGKAEKPVYLKVFDDNVEICDAGELWGKDLYVTTDWLWKTYGEECSVSAIGQAGENLVIPSLVLTDKIGSWLRGGGAVWGSKNLKAITVRGTKGVRIADKKNFLKLTDDLTERSKNYKYRQDWVDWGLMINWDRFVVAGGGFPVKNSREMFPAEKLDELYGRKVINEQMDKFPIACASCTSSDKHMLRMKAGDYEGFETYFSSIFTCFYEAMMCNVNYGNGLKLHDKIQRYGLEMLTSNPMIEWAIELYENGIITKEDTGGLELSHDYDVVTELNRQIAYREGIGDILADGWVKAVERIGKGSESYGVFVKGNSPPLDFRVSFGTDSLSGVISPRIQLVRGGSPTLLSAVVPIDLFRKWSNKVGVPEDIWDRLGLKESPVNIPRITKYAEDWMTLFDCLGICGRATVNRLYYGPTLEGLYSTLTGIDVSIENLLQAGERAFNMERVLNVREGFNRKDDRLPERYMTEPLKDGEKEVWLEDFYRTKRLTKDEFDKMLDDYYDERGWDVEKGIPTRQKLDELDLKDVAIDLEKNGFIYE